MKRCRYTHIRDKKGRGWGRNLYRNPEQGILGGVCAGLAENFDVENWIVRLVFVGGFFFFGGLTLFIYIALWVFLARKDSQLQYEYEYDERYGEYRPKKVFRYQAQASQRLLAAEKKIRRARERVEVMERYVTSRRFDLEKEFSRMKD